MDGPKKNLRRQRDQERAADAFAGLGGPRLEFALPLAVSTGGLRVAADKHWLTDVLAGAAVGAITSRIR